MYLIHCDNQQYNLLYQALECVEHLSIGEAKAWTDAIQKGQCVGPKEKPIPASVWERQGAANIVALWKTTVMGQPIEGAPVFNERHKRLFGIKPKFTRPTQLTNLEALSLKKIRAFGRKNHIPVELMHNVALEKTINGWTLNKIPIPETEFQNWFVHQQPWELILDDSELRTLSDCLDTYSRFLMGQYEIVRDIATLYSVNNKHPDWDTSQVIASEISTRIFGVDRLNFGIHHPKLAPEAQQTYSLYQVLRYCESHHRNPSGGMQTCYDAPRFIPSNFYVTNPNVSMDSVYPGTILRPIASKNTIEKWHLQCNNQHIGGSLLQVAILRSKLSEVTPPEPLF